MLDVPALLTERFRRQRAAGSGAPFQVPELRPGHVARPALLDPLCVSLAAAHDPPAFRVVALHGMPGSGKSELAIAAARDARVLNRYPDGVLWGVLGLAPDLSGLLGSWILELGIAIGTALTRLRRRGIAHAPAGARGVAGAG